MMKGQTAELTAVLEPADSTDQVTWESNNDKVATVSKSGKVTAVKEGSARIIARANDDVYGYADITV